MTDYIVALSTFGSDDEAVTVATAVVKDGLAACAQRLNIGSTYQWNDDLVQDSEVLVLFKTRADLYDLLQARIVDLHSYDTPEVIQIPVMSGLGSYFAWIDSNTRQP